MATSKKQTILLDAETPKLVCTITGDGLALKEREIRLASIQVLKARHGLALGKVTTVEAVGACNSTNFLVR